MRSKSSKRPAKWPHPKKHWPGCDEKALAALAQDLSRCLRPGDRVFLEGEMGVGKSTFARALIQSLQVQSPQAGSPTFAIVHEYSGRLPQGEATEIYHLDFYRIDSEEELEQRGISEYFWERSGISIVEWVSRFPPFFSLLSRPMRGRRNWKISFFWGSEPHQREIRVDSPT